MKQIELLVGMDVTEEEYVKYAEYEVIRCENCKSFTPSANGMTGWCERFSKVLFTDDFCSYGTYDIEKECS